MAKLEPITTDNGLYGKEKFSRYYSPEQIVASLLRDGFKATIKSMREKADHTEEWRITLSKKF